MRKILCFIAIALMGVAAFAQTVTLTFTGRDAADHYVQLNRVSITNLTKGWQETIYWPDTTLTMQNGTGIDESVANGGFALSQNNPNPFTGTTDVNLTVADAGAVTLEIVDGNGKIVETRHGTSLQPGTNQFRVSLSSAGTYVMTARQNGKTSSIKMVCHDGGNANGIDYLGMVQTITYVLKSTTNNPFTFGDQMEYVGYATINGTEMESQRITQAQGTSQTFVLQFDATQLYAPSVMTASVSDITAVSATCGGIITSDGGAIVTARGVCWSTSHNPTVSSNHTTDGSGTGSFTSTLTSLTPNTTYYVRAYATNSAGTAYGNEVSFATECDSVSVNISGNTEINYGESATLTATGADTYHWSNNAVTEIITVTPIITTTYTVTGTNLYGCYDEDSITVTVNPVAPTVSTGSVILTPNSATCGGDVNSDGGATVTARGVCWSASPNPTISGSYTTDGTGTGSFTSNLTGLTAGTTYYVRAYATNSVGTAYGNEVSFVAAVLPVVNTATPTNIMATSATCGGNVTNDGSAVVTDRGVCWSTTHNPTTSNSHTTDGSGTGSFTSSLTGLTTGTTYYVRAYATNSLGTAYGIEVSFTTTTEYGQPCSGAATVTDIDNNTYNTVQIGDQCWMRENLRTTRYSNGTHIALGNDTSSTTAYRYYPDDDSSNVSTCGYLYNGKAVMGNSSSSSANPSGVQGICPDGWHVPSDAEWTQLTNYVSSQSQYVCGGDNTYIAKALASTTGWNSNSNTCVVGNNPSTNNATGFSALPAGMYYGYYWCLGDNILFWSASEGYYDWSYTIFCLYSNNARVIQNNGIKVNGYSVRCVCDENVSSTTQLPTVTTYLVSNVEETSASCDGNVTSDGGATVTARGVCWSTSQNPTISDSFTTDGSGIGSFTSSLTGLIAGVTYYVRAYATNIVGTAYGNEVSFTAFGEATHCPGMPTLTDIDGNVYYTVRIGYQCWMRENLRTTRYSNGTYIALGSRASTTTAYRYYPANNQSYVSDYGYLYNWKAVMGNSSSSSENPSGVQGICPVGWHVPSRAEWVQLTNYVSSHSQYMCGNNTSMIAKALASTTGWSSHNDNTCNVGYTPSNNNATGFSALPAGYLSAVNNGNDNYGDLSYYSRGYEAHFWSTTEYAFSSDFADNYTLRNCDPIVTNGSSRKYEGISVRCVCDESVSSILPTVTTSLISNVAETSASCGGNVTSDGGATITARGVCWSTSQNPTISDNHTTDGSGAGSFTSSLTGLTAGCTTYYVRAYATNSVGTAYGNEVSFTTTPGSSAQDGQPCPGTPTLTDIDGNTYNTVQIGSQCWMKENLKTTKYADGTSISHGTSSASTAYWYYPNNNSSNKPIYGLLYNWKAVMHNSASSTSNPSGVQGICPTGWHVPSDAEWTQLTDYVSSQSQYVCGGDNTQIGKALAGTTGWATNTSSITNPCAVENAPSNNNATGFSAVPAGVVTGTYQGFGYGSYFLSATEYSTSDAFSLSIGGAYAPHSHEPKSCGRSVRCIKD